MISFLKSILFLGLLLYFSVRLISRIYKYFKNRFLYGGLSSLELEYLKQVVKLKLNTPGEFEAVKYVMDRTGWTFEKAKSFCEKLVDDKPLQQLVDDKPIPKVPTPDKKEGSSKIIQETISEDELVHLVKEKLILIGKLATIKFVTDKTGWGLKKSKEFCDKIADEADLNDSDKQPELGTVALPSIKASKVNPWASLELNSASKSLTKGNVLVNEDEVKSIMNKMGWTYEKAEEYCKSLKQYDEHINKPFKLKTNS
jgi:hypothetical protein